jgi:Zn-dependent protease
MDMLQQGLLVVVLAVGTLIAVMLAIITQRLARLLWQRSTCHTVPRGEMPATSRAILDLPARELAEMGFVYRYSGSARKAVVTPKDEPTFFDMYQHADGHTHAMVSPAPVPDPRQPCMIQLISCLNNGRNWTTLNRCRHFSPMNVPNWKVFDDYLAQWKDAWQRHLQRVQAVAPAALCTDGIEVKRRLDQAFEDVVPHMRKRGQLVRTPGSKHYRLTWRAALRFAVIALGGQWRAAWAARRQPRPALAPVTAQGAEAEMKAFGEQLALRRSTTATGKSKLLVFAVTAILFLIVGGWWLSWSFVPVLLTVVALHEGGHYLAMRLTGYRNVSVFFLPGLGGLATGEKADATPMEKLFVYLAGPVPGILLAGGGFWASSAGLWDAPAWLNEFLIASLAINYLNLLPVSPLDGGRVLETFAFARHPRLRFGFAVLCCGLLLAAGIALDDLVLKVVAVVVAISLSHQWRVMRLDLDVARDDSTALDEQQALQRIFATLQGARFQAWPFATRAAAATTLLPELMGRRPRGGEAFGGLLIYAVCLLGPVAAAFVAVPQLGAVLPYATPLLTMAPDDVDPEPAAPPQTAPPDWTARLAQAATLPKEDLLEAYLGAGQQAIAVEDRTAGLGHFRAAWQIAKDLPERDLRRIDALEGLAAATNSDQEQRQILTQIIAELAQPQGQEVTRVASTKEQLSYTDLPAPERVELLRDAVALRSAAASGIDHTLSYTRLALAQALEEAGDAAGAETVLRTRIGSLSVSDAADRSRKGLQNRVQSVTAGADLAWFLIDHGRAADAMQVASQALYAVPAKVTASWVHPQQQTLEALVWAQLLSPALPELPAQWTAYDDALRNGFTGQRKMLFHETDRALVARTLQDTRMQARAKSGVQEALSNLSQRPAILCKPPMASSRTNWRRQQQETRRRMLTELGVCAPA